MRRKKTFCTPIAQLSLLFAVIIGMLLTGCHSFVNENSYGIPCSMARPAPADALDGREMIQLADVDEVWVITKPKQAQAATPGLRADLVAVSPVDQTYIPLPLKHTAVTANISGYVADVTVKQQYSNPYSEKIEAVYVFPLPQNSAVTDFIMTVGSRRIRGIIRERKEAEEIYRQAKQQGYHAALLTQERPNIFTQKVANIEPGKSIDIDITFFNTLQFSQGQFEFVLPTVVGPRFNPSGSKNGILAVPRGHGADSFEQVSVCYLAPNERNGHDLSIQINLDATVPIQTLMSPTHAIKKSYKNPSYATIELAQKSMIPNKDFILRYSLSGKKMATAVMVNNDPDKPSFAAMLLPPKDLKYLPRQPRELIFVVDCSGSMEGQPIAKAKEAMRYCLKSLTPEDSFQIIRFSQKASSMGDKLLSGTPENIKTGLDFIDNIQAGGGTYMMNGINASLNFPGDKDKLRIISFMTDGYIGNERDILKVIKEKVGHAKIFSFGIGSSVNRYLIERMAQVGNGAAAYVGLNDNSLDTVNLFYDRCSRPALSKISIDWGKLNAIDVFPKKIPDLFVGRPVLITGRYTGSPNATITVNGIVGGEKRSFQVKSCDIRNDAIQSIWARNKIKSMQIEELTNPSEKLKEEITGFSIKNRVLCQYTAFLAVDATERTKGDHGYSLKVPVPVPDGVRYDTTVR